MDERLGMHANSDGRHRMLLTLSHDLFSQLGVSKCIWDSYD